LFSVGVKGYVLVSLALVFKLVSADEASLVADALATTTQTRLFTHDVWGDCPLFLRSLLAHVLSRILPKESNNWFVASD